MGWSIFASIAGMGRGPQDVRSRPEETPHNHTADAFRYAAIAMRDGDATPKPKDKPRFLNEMTLDELWGKTPKGRARI
jgi:hypothetical protein